SSELHPHRAHVAEAEEPGGLTHGPVLAQLGAVVQRHEPAGEARHPGAERLVLGAQGGHLVHHASSKASAGGQLHMRLRSPNALSIRLTGGKYLSCRSPGTGKAAWSRL